MMLRPGCPSARSKGRTPTARSSSDLAAGDSRASEIPTASAYHEVGKAFLESRDYACVMPEWSFRTNHARALVCIAHDPGVRRRDIAATLGITERRGFGVVTDLTGAGCVVNEMDGRRNRYRI
jgi:hypothetical protein